MINLGNDFKFDINDIPKDEWNLRARKEAEEIKTNPKDKHRDLESDIFPQVKRGHAAEWFAMAVVIDVLCVTIKSLVKNNSSGASTLIQIASSLHLYSIDSIYLSFVSIS